MKKRITCAISTVTSSFFLLAVISSLLFCLFSPIFSSDATAAGPIYNWSTVSALGTKYWTTLATSKDGSTMLAGGFGSSTDDQSYLYLSTDGGTTWIQTANNEHSSWNRAAISEDGSTLVAVEYSSSNYGPGNVYISHDHGSTWTIANALPPSYWVAVAVSKDGSAISVAQQFGATDGNGLVYTSTDGGATWLAASCTARWNDIAMSADGSIIMAAPSYDPSYNPGYLYLSTDGGVSWSQVSVGNRGYAYWGGVSMTDDGHTIVAVENREGSYASGDVYISHDQGASWTETSAPTGLYNSVGMSADGQIILAAQENDQTGNNPGIAILSTDGGVTWSQVPIDPQNFDTAVVSRDGSILGLTAETQDGTSGTYGNVYLAHLIPPPVQPTISTIHAGDATLIGATSPGATVTAHFGGDVTASATVDSSGNFSITVPASIMLSVGYIVTFDAISPQGTTSETTSAIVQAVPMPPGDGSGSGTTQHSSEAPTLAPTGSSMTVAAVFGTGLLLIGGMMAARLRRSRKHIVGTRAR